MNRWYDTVQEPWRFALFMALVIPICVVMAFLPWTGLGLFVVLLLLRLSRV